MLCDPLYDVVTLLAGDVILAAIYIGNFNKLTPTRGVDMDNLHSVQVEKSPIVSEETYCSEYRGAGLHLSALDLAYRGYLIIFKQGVVRYAVYLYAVIGNNHFARNGENHKCENGNYE